MKYSKLDLGKIEAIVNKLGGMEGVQRFLSGVTIVNFKIWEYVRLGREWKNLPKLKEKLVGNQIKISDWAEDVIFTRPGFKLYDREKFFALVRVSKTDLGLEETATDDEAIAKAKTLGLYTCPAEVGPQLRAKYTNQPKGERLRIAMEPIVGAGGKPHVFEVAHDSNGLWLGNDSTNQKQSGHHLYGKYDLIFYTDNE